MPFSSTEGSAPKPEVPAGTYDNACDAQLLRECLGVAPTPMRMNSQARPSMYCSLARGDGVRFRLGPDTGRGHGCASCLLVMIVRGAVEEAGGVITNRRGPPFDFGLRRTLAENFGMVMFHVVGPGRTCMRR